MINFPGVGLKFNISKVAFSIWGIDIYWYAICIVIGIIIAMICCKILSKKDEIDFDNLFYGIIISIIIGIIGARIYYVLFNLRYYLENPAKIFAIRDGGLAIFGGIIFGGISLLIYCKKKNLNYLKVFDVIAPCVAIAQSIGRWGNFFNQEAYGYETKNFLRMGIVTKYGYQEVHPAFLYESICTLIIFVVLLLIRKHKKYDGQIFLLYLLMYSGIRMLIENLRTDSLNVFNLRVSRNFVICTFCNFRNNFVEKIHKL